MLQLTKKIMLAITVVTDIGHISRGAPVQSQTLATRQSVPNRHLEQVLQTLVKNKILKGVRGPKGGYNLARERRLINLGEIVRAIIDSEPHNNTIGKKLDSELFVNVIEPIWFDVQSEILEKLDSVTVEDLCNSARQKGIKGKTLDNLNFDI